MPSPSQIHPSPACFTRTQAQTVDADGVKTAFSTSVTPQTILPAALNGAVLVASGAGVLRGPDRLVTITRSNNANQFSTSPIVLTGKDGLGRTVSVSVTFANDDGNDSKAFPTAVREIVSVYFPGDGGAGGTYTIGVTDLVCLPNQPFRQVRGGAVGDLGLVFADGSTDTLPTAAGEHHDVATTRLDAATTTAWPVTLYA